MGGHYGSIQIRTVDRDRVRDAAEHVAAARSIKFLLGPAKNGWVGLYPEGNGQDDAVGRAVAAALPDADVLMLQVHDDDVFAYQLYRNGIEVDAFNASPDYFGDNSAERAKVGNAEAFRPLIGDAVAKLAPLITRDDADFTAFEMDRLDAFAKVLKIANAVQAYEYLIEDDHGGVKGWKQFEKIPAEAATNAAAARRQATAAFNRTVKRLRADGTLLHYDAQASPRTPHVCAAGGGFIIAWTDWNTDTQTNFWRPPWTTPISLPLDPPSRVNAVAVDAAGRRVAVAAGQAVRVFDLTDADWTPIASVPEADLVLAVALSADGRTVAHLSRKELVVTEVATGDRRFVHSGEGYQTLAFHPSGNWLAVGGMTLGVVTLGVTPAWQDRFIGGRSVNEQLGRQFFQSKLRGMDWSDMERQRTEAMASAMKKLEKMLSGPAMGKLPPDQLAEMRRTMEKGVAEMMGNLTALRDGTAPPPPPRANEKVHRVGFSDDGRDFWCGTSAGLRVFDAAAVVTTPSLPAPRLEHTPRADRPGTPSVTAGQSADALFFTTGDGSLGRLSLTDGSVATVLSPLDPLHCFAVTLSADGQSLAAVYQPSLEDQASRATRKTTLAVFDTAKLRALGMTSSSPAV